MVPPPLQFSGVGEDDEDGGGGGGTFPPVPPPVAAVGSGVSHAGLVAVESVDPSSISESIVRSSSSGSVFSVEVSVEASTSRVTSSVLGTPKTVSKLIGSGSSEIFEIPSVRQSKSSLSRNVRWLLLSSSAANSV